MFDDLKYQLGRLSKKQWMIIGGVTLGIMLLLTIGGFFMSQGNKSDEPIDYPGGGTVLEGVPGGMQGDNPNIDENGNVNDWNNTAPKDPGQGLDDGAYIGGLSFDEFPTRPLINAGIPFFKYDSVELRNQLMGLTSQAKVVIVKRNVMKELETVDPEEVVKEFQNLN